MHQEENFLLLIGRHCTPVKTILNIIESDNVKCCSPAVTVGNYDEALRQQSALQSTCSCSSYNEMNGREERPVVMRSVKKVKRAKGKEL